MQRGERVHERLHIHGVDRPATTDPLPLIVRPADQALFVIGEKRQPVDLFRFEPENRQLLPQQRIGKNIIERERRTATTNGSSPTRAKIFSPSIFPNAIVARGCSPALVSAVFSDANELRVTVQLRLIETIFRQIGCNVCDEICHLLARRAVN